MVISLFCNPDLISIEFVTAVSKVSDFISLYSLKFIPFLYVLILSPSNQVPVNK